MANVIDNVSKIEFTDTNAYDPNQTDPFDGTNEILVQRITDSGDRPQSEPVMTTFIDGVESQSSDGITLGYAIIEDDTDTTVIDNIIAFVNNSDRVWVKETLRPLSAGGDDYPQLIGGSAGCGVSISKQSRGRGEPFEFMIMLNATETVAGELIKPLPTYTP